MPGSDVWHEHATRLLPLIQASGTPARVLIDGGSGSGKSSLARAVHGLWADAQLVRLDDLYPGWDGLEAASVQVRERVLEASGAGWTRWDWELDAAAEWHPIDPAAPLIVEGSGSLSRANRELATFAVWVALDAPTRKARALARDGATYAPHWDRWAAQERAFFERERPDLLADVVIDESRS